MGRFKTKLHVMNVCQVETKKVSWRGAEKRDRKLGRTRDHGTVKPKAGGARALDPE